MMEKWKRTMRQNRALLSIVIGVFIIGIIAYYASSSLQFNIGMGRNGNRHAGDHEIYYTTKAVLSSINTLLLVILASIYLKVYRETGLEFSFGLLIFSVALLLYSLVSNPLIVRFAGFRGSGLGPFAMLPDLFTCIASLTLLYISK
jgi:hypothetical protein